MKRQTIVRLSSVAAIAGTLVVLPAERSLADVCDDEWRTETGVCQTAPVDPGDGSPPATEDTWQEKAVYADNMADGLRVDGTHDGSSAAGVSPQIIPGDPRLPPAGFTLAEVANMTIYREGEGNGKKSFTCGPSTTRNMVAAMYKRRYGYYQDYGEHQFELWEGTQPGIGTSSAAVSTTLNNHFSAFGSWTTRRPSDKYAYMSMTITNTWAFHQGIPQFVGTEELPYFKGHALDHVNLLYGYDKTSDPWYVYIAEEYDPYYLFGTKSYQPYGKWKVRNLYGYQAVVKTSYHKMVV